MRTQMMSLLLVCFAGTACIPAFRNDSDTDAYGAGADEVHLVVAAPLASSVEQRLWICKGNSVKEGTPANGYLVSIGVGTGAYSNVRNQTPANRNRSGSNLTPVGEFEIVEKIGSTCAPGMTTRCLALDGVEDGINDNALARGIFIHGTPSTNYPYLGESASHGCVRMHNEDVKKVYDRVAVGTRLFINSQPVPEGKNPCAFVGDRDGRAR